MDSNLQERSGMGEPFLRLKIIKRFPGFSLDCEATFESGITAIFGPSGSGKSTLLNCITGLMSPDAGEIEVAGTTVYSSSSRKNVSPEKRRFGYVFQESALFPHMNVKENIMYGYKLTPAHQRKIDPEHLVELFQLSSLMNRGVTNLSGGERQRVALARALATSPSLMLLDEPLASLDGRFRGVIIEYLKRVWEELGTPVVYVSHSISEVMALAENTLALRGGRPVAYGRTTQVLVHPDVSKIADYTTLENLIEAEIVSKQSEKGLAKVRIGNICVKTPEVSGQAGEKVMVSIRAGDIILALGPPTKLSARNTLEASISEIHTVGHRVLVYIDVGTQLVAEITLDALRDLDLREGQQVHLIIKTNSILVLEASGSITG